MAEGMAFLFGPIGSLRLSVNSLHNATLCRFFTYVGQTGFDAMAEPNSTMIPTWVNRIRTHERNCLAGEGSYLIIRPFSGLRLWQLFAQSRFIQARLLGYLWFEIREPFADAKKFCDSCDGTNRCLPITIRIDSMGHGCVGDLVI